MARRHYSWLAAVIFVVIGVVLFGSSGRDDCYISFWPAYTLAQYGEILNYNGDRVEQSSSLLHVLVLGGSSFLTGLEPHDLGRPLSILFGALAVGAVAKLGGLGAAVLSATSLPLVYWSFGGLETSLYALLLVLLCLKMWWTIPLLVMVRPEAQFVLCLAFAICWLSSRDRIYGYLISATVVSAVILMIWRVTYFGQAFPQPVMAKVGGLQLSEGFTYLLYCWPFLLMAIALPFAPERKLEAGIAASVLAFVVASGGDWMEGARFLAPIAPLAAVAGAAFLKLRLFFFATGFIWLVSFVWLGSTGTPIWVPRPDGNFWEVTNTVHRRDIPVAEALIDVASSQDSPQILSGQMGFVVYKTTLALYPRIRVYDRAGLVENSMRHLSRGKTRMGYGITYGDAIEHKRPSIIFDLTDMREQMEAHGYDIIYWQSGMVSGSLPADQFIAIRRRDNVPDIGSITDDMEAMPSLEND